LLAAVRALRYHRGALRRFGLIVLVICGSWGLADCGTPAAVGFDQDQTLAIAAHLQHARRLVPLARPEGGVV
jgi:hypothetical protein